VWTIGDAAHRSRPSDHNPNPAGVVCAVDVVGRTQAAAVWRHLLASRDPRVKYAIFDRQIVSTTTSPWQVRNYTGANPHTGHVHVSVGRGPSGGSTRADLYDDAAPWRLPASPSPTPTPTDEGFLMALTDAEQREVLAAARELTRAKDTSTDEAGRRIVPDAPASRTIRDRVWQTNRAAGITAGEVGRLKAAVDKAADGDKSAAVDAKAIVDELSRRLGT
jgi:hypothetical protein